MYHTLKIVGCSLYLAAFSVLATASVYADKEAGHPSWLNHLVPIEPYPADWKVAYTKHLNKHLDLDAVYFARMIVKPSFGAEYMMRIHGDFDSYDINSSKAFYVTCKVADRSIWYAMPMNNDEKVQKDVKSRMYRAPMPAKTAKRISVIWREIILRTRYPRNGAGGLDGVTIEFASIHGHGQAWSPRDSTIPAQLWNLGEKVISYSKGKPDERVTLLAAIHKSVTILEARLKK